MYGHGEVIKTPKRVFVHAIGLLQTFHSVVYLLGKLYAVKGVVVWKPDKSRNRQVSSVGLVQGLKLKFLHKVLYGLSKGIDKQFWF